MNITKQDIDNLLTKFQDCSWIEPEEADEIREYLHGRIDNDTLDAINLEACFDEDYAICAPSYMWETLEKIRSQK